MLCSKSPLFYATKSMCLVTGCAGFDVFTKTVSSGLDYPVVLFFCVLRKSLGVVSVNCLIFKDSPSSCTPFIPVG